MQKIKTTSYTVVAKVIADLKKMNRTRTGPSNLDRHPSQQVLGASRKIKGTDLMFIQKKTCGWRVQKVWEDTGVKVLRK